MCDVQTPTNGPALLPDFQELEAFRHLSAQQHAPTIENRNLSSAYMPPSPLARPSNQVGNVFNFAGFNTSPNDQFQTQLIQQLQNLNNTYHNQKCNNNLYGQPMPGLYVPQTVGSQNNANSPSFRLSQASSFSSSPILSHGSNDSPSKVSDGRVGKDDSHLIKPLSQGETITTTDSDGRVKVIVPVNEEDIPVPRLEPPPSGHRRSKEASPTKLGNQSNDINSLEMEDSHKHNSQYLPNGPYVTRTASEKVPHRSELMLQVQRTAWARHTTK